MAFLTLQKEAGPLGTSPGSTTKGLSLEMTMSTPKFQQFPHSFGFTHRLLWIVSDTLKIMDYTAKCNQDKIMFAQEGPTPRMTQLLKRNFGS